VSLAFQDSVLDPLLLYLDQWNVTSKIPDVSRYFDMVHSTIEAKQEGRWTLLESFDFTVTYLAYLSEKTLRLD